MEHTCNDINPSTVDVCPACLEEKDSRKRVIVTGSRVWVEKYRLEMVLNGTHLALNRAFILVHGGCPTGADRMADEWGRAKKGVTVKVFEADWDTYHRGAGPKRNQQMVDAGADLLIAFLMEGSKGTADCLKRAELAGIPTLVIRP